MTDVIDVAQYSEPTKYQQDIIDLHMSGLEESENLNELRNVAHGFAVHRKQPWLMNRLMPLYGSKLRQFRDGMPARSMVLIDLMNWACADWHATKGQDECVSMFFRRARKIADMANACWVVVAAESEVPLERNRKFADYKKNRRPHEDGLLETVAAIEAHARDHGVVVLRHDGWEADDVMATMSTLASAGGDRSLVCTNDRDSLQLVKKDRCATFSKNEVTNEQKLFDDTGLRPDQYVDYLAIVGKDDVPGWEGVGDKTARELLAAYGSLVEIHAASGTFTGAKRESWEKFKPFALTAKDLHTLNRWLSFSFDWDVYTNIAGML